MEKKVKLTINTGQVMFTGETYYYWPLNFFLISNNYYIYLKRYFEKNVTNNFKYILEHSCLKYFVLCAFNKHHNLAIIIHTI